MVDKIKYTVASVTDYSDEKDKVEDKGELRAKRKVQVTARPSHDDATGVFASMAVTAQNQAYRPSVPAEITLVFEETKGAFPWGVGDKLTLQFG